MAKIYHKDCGGELEYYSNINFGCGDNDCCGGYIKGYECIKCNEIIDEFDTDFDLYQALAELDESPEHNQPSTGAEESL